MENKELSGIINVYKQADWTSFDVVAKMRGIVHMKKIGHGGTLDPMATGVLPVLIGKATRACDMLPDTRKAYKAGFKLGLTTDTLDITGKVLTKNEGCVAKADIISTIETFVGDIMQIPPMYSAVKINGQKLCNLARQGIVIERPPRPVHINSITLISYDENSQQGEIYVDCCKGTYVRTIIDDMGQALGCGAIMTSLERTLSAGFAVENSYTLEQIAKLYNEDRIEEILLPVDNAFNTVYKNEIHLEQRLIPLYKNGVKLELRQLNLSNDQSYLNQTILVYGNNEFLGLAGINEENILKSIKNFY